MMGGGQSMRGEAIAIRPPIAGRIGGGAGPADFSLEEMGPGDYNAWQERMPTFDLDAYVARSGAVDLDAIAWDEVPRHPLPPEAVRTLRYMQDIESHTIIYLRALLATRAVDDPEVATFLACWLYEETFHGIALRRFLEAAGHPIAAARAAAGSGAAAASGSRRRRRPSCPRRGPTSAPCT